MYLEFDVRGFLDTLGPKTELAEFCGVARTAPYGWARRGYLSSVMMARLVEYGKHRRLGLDINKFFVRPEVEEKRPASKRKGSKKNGRG